MVKIYLACPYTHDDTDVMEQRFEDANKAAAYFLKLGFNVLSPISHSHPISQYMGNSQDSKFWCDVDEEWQRHCDALYVLKVDGWDKSSGVRREIDLALTTGQPIVWVDPNTYSLRASI